MGGGYKIPRLVVEKSDSDREKEVIEDENSTKNENSAMDALKNKIDKYNYTNALNIFRKRKEDDMAGPNTDVFSVSSSKKRPRVSAPELGTSKRKSRTSAASVKLMNEWILNKKLTTSTPIRDSSRVNCNQPQILNPTQQRSLSRPDTTQ